MGPDANTCGIPQTIQFNAIELYISNLKPADFESISILTPASINITNMVLHFERAGNPSKQDIIHIQISETLDNFHRQPSWQAVIDRLGQSDDFGINYYTGNDKLMV